MSEKNNGKRQRSERGRIGGAEHSVGTVAGKELFRITFGNIGVRQGNVRKPFADG